MSPARVCRKQRDPVCAPRHPDFSRGTSVLHRWALPIEFLPLQALTPEKIHQWEEQAGSQKVWRTRVISGTILPGPCSARYFAAAQDPCALPRCAVPSSGKPCLSCTHHKQSSASEAASGAAGSLAAASDCCKVHLLTHQESLTEHLFLQQVRRMLSAAQLLALTSEVPSGRTSLRGSLLLWMLNTNL